MFHRRRIFFKLMRVIFTFFIGLLIALFIAVSQINIETIQKKLISALSESGLELKVKGKTSWKFSLKPKLELRNINISFNKSNIVSSKTIEVSLNLISLLQTKTIIQNISISDGDIYLDSLNKKNKNLAEQDNEYIQDYPFNINFGIDSINLNNIKIHSNDDIYKFDNLSIKRLIKKDSIDYVGWIKSDFNFLPFVLSFLKFDTVKNIYPINFAISLSNKPLTANIALEKTNKTPIDFSIKGEIAKLYELGKILNIELIKINPINLDIHGGFDNKKVFIRKFKASSNNTNFDIKGFIDLKKSLINLDIKSGYFSLLELFPELYGRSDIVINRQLNAFKNVPLFGKFFKDLNININLVVGKFLMYRELSLEKLNILLNLENSKLKLDISSNFIKGNIKAKIKGFIDNDYKYNLESAGRGFDLSVGKLLKDVRNSGYVSGLPSDFGFYLRGRGFDLSELMASLTGKILLYSVDSGDAETGFTEYMFGKDFFSSIGDNIHNFVSPKNDQKKTTISCIVGNVKIRNGKIDTQNGIVMQTNRLNYRIVGNLDFGAEVINSSIVSTPASGLKLSISNNIVNSIVFSGNLSEPDIKINSGSVATKIVSSAGIGFLLSPFTAGMSIIAGAGIGFLAGSVIENWLSDSSPCETAVQNGTKVKEGDPDWLDLPINYLIDDFNKQ